MNNANSENTFFSGSERPAMKWITLPADLASWADKNKELVERVQNALSETYDTLSEEQLWEVIASASSPEWQEARNGLRIAEQQWKSLNSPEKTSLGLIGNALDSAETNNAMEQFASSLANFTIINEGLRQREDLSRLLSVLLVQKRMLDRSTEQTQNLKNATENFASMAFKDAGAKTKKAPKAEKKKPQDTNGIRGAFRLYAGKLFQAKRAAERNNTLSSPKR